MTKRKPDAVFNVWGDGKPMVDSTIGFDTADEKRIYTNRHNPPPWRITHRILVYLKDKRA